MNLLESHTDFEFENSAIETFCYQAQNNLVYKQYLKLLHIVPDKIKTINEIPFLPVSFFKTHKITTSEFSEIIFTSSGTTGDEVSKHYVKELSLYKNSFKKCFDLFYQNPTDYCILALLPSYLEREGSSLVYMVNELIKLSNNKDSGFFLDNFSDLNNIIKKYLDSTQKVLLLGVSFALLDLVEKFPQQLSYNFIVMETGGMKGRKKEITRRELHEKLSAGFGVSNIHSEYGMTELLSQAYSKGNGKYNCPPWMKVLIRDTSDPFQLIENGKTGGINIIDLANRYSCSFIETQDLGKCYNDGSFEVLGRFDYSQVRGCNLLLG
ncbi:MAG: acyl transferase [Bacteroidia bacterium]|nr:acyl transferase [Bacteroidia bacterium]